MTTRWSARLAWACGVAAFVLGAGVAPALDYVNGERQVLHELLSTGTLIAVSFGLVGALVAARRPRNPLGWLFLVAAVCEALAEVTGAYAKYTIVTAPDRGLSGGVVAAWVAQGIWFPAFACLLTFIPLLFPTGALPSPRWRPVAWLAGLGVALVVVATLGLPPSAVDAARIVTDRPPEDEGPMAVVGMIGYFAVVLASPACVVALLGRLRRAGQEERQQVKWFAYAGLLTASLVLGSGLAQGGVVVDILHATAAFLLPGAAAVAILRHGLFDIDLLINRSLVYGALTGGLLALYVGVVTGAERLAQRSGLSVSVLAAAVVAVVVEPARALLQRSVNRLLYGRRGDPRGAVIELEEAMKSAGDRAELLPTVAATVAHALRLPYVALEVADGNGGLSTVTHGKAPVGEPHVLPLTHQGLSLGRLVASPRAPNGRLNAADIHVLEDLTRQTSTIVHTLLLAVQLQRSRQQLVAAREEERRRLGRDLHDDLGPTLAGAALELAAARMLLQGDPGGADARLARLAGRIKGAIEDVRRLAVELRPPALDQLGLVGAIREGASTLSASTKIDVVIDGPVDGLPAGVEIAAYRIVQEALVNVTRHAKATSCIVRLTCQDQLSIDVVDDGRGLPRDTPVGVGLRSMRERAEELGGTFSVGLLPEGGTAVHAVIPLDGPG